MLLTPKGKTAGTTDRIMLLAMWANHLRSEISAGKSLTPKIIAAGMGKPTFPINTYAARAAVQYWNTFGSRSQDAWHVLSGDGVGIKATRDAILKMDAAIGYGDPQGDIEPRTKMAKALTRWYSDKIPHKERVSIEPEHVLFTVGGAGALHVIFEVINRRFPKGRIITPFPHYSLYVGSGGKNNLHPIHVMQEPGYSLTSESLATSIEHAKKLAEIDGCPISAFLMCDPNNPLGTVIDDKELEKIAKILRNNPNFFIILDEAYAEMRFDGRQSSFLCIAPDLKNRIILIRSATKALSAAGERMAVIVTFDEVLMGDFIQENIDNYGHAPRSLQHTFAEAMDRLDEIELKTIINYYKFQVNYVMDRLAKMGAAMPDPYYKVAGTFYVLGDFSDLFGLSLPEETRRVLNKSGKITTDEDIAYYLLFTDGVMIAPLSYFGLSPKNGYMRITCSGGDEELKTLMDRLEDRLIAARKNKQKIILNQINICLDKIKQIATEKYNLFFTKINKLLEYQQNPNTVTASGLKGNNYVLMELLSDIEVTFNRLSEKEIVQSAIKMQSFFRKAQAEQEFKKLKAEMDNKWYQFVNLLMPNPCTLKSHLLFLSHSERNNFYLWEQYLKNPNLFNPINTNKVRVAKL